MPKKDIPAYVAALVKRADLNISDADKETLLRDVKNGKANRACMRLECTKGGTFNYEGEKQRLYCLDHKLANMFNVASKMCKECKKRIAIYGTEEGGELLYCADCKDDDMVDNKNKKCAECGNSPSFGIEDAKTPTHCSEHKTVDMVDIKHGVCADCKELSPSYTIKGETKPTHCANCAKKYGDEMEDVKHKKCEGCLKLIASFNDKGEATPKYCSGCKAPEMKDVVNRKCACGTSPSYAMPGETSPTHCLSCKTSKMENVLNNKCQLCNIFRYIAKYDRHCSGCYYYLHPDDPKIRNYKVKEQAFTTQLAKLYPNAILDKRVEGGCSKRRPDCMIERYSHVIIIEIDEAQHMGYDSTCEIQRINDLYTDLGDRNIVFIRLNPDGYKIGGVRKRGVFTLSKKTNGLIINPTEFKRRFETLVENIQQALENPPEEPITTVSLYYSVE